MKVYKFNEKELTDFDKKFKYSGNVDKLWIYGERTNRHFAIQPLGNGDMTSWSFQRISTSGAVSTCIKFTPKTNKEFVEFIENKLNNTI